MSNPSLSTPKEFAENLGTLTPIALLVFEELSNLTESWFSGVQGFDKKNFPADLMLVVTELAEACEGDRKPHPDRDCPEFDNRVTEIADALVRIFHMCGKYDLPIGPAFIAKMNFNLTRPVKHGKEY